MSRQTRTTIMGMLVLAGRKLSASQLIRLARPLGLSPTNVKSHLTRMVAEGALRREGPTRLATYHPSPRQMLVINGIRARLTEAPNESWDQSWLMLTLQLPANRIEREQMRASLWFDGFRPVSPYVFVRPAWPLPWAQGRAWHYSHQALGFCVRGKLIAATRAPTAFYDLEGINAEAQRLAGWTRRKTAYAASPCKAFIDRMNVGGRVARLIGHDPRLPAALWGRRRGIYDMIRAFRRFEEHVAPAAQVFLAETLDQKSRKR